MADMAGRLNDELGKALLKVTFQQYNSDSSPISTPSRSQVTPTRDIECVHSGNGSSKDQLIHPKAKECIITLCKILDNILLEKRYNLKTRSIKLGNRVFRERVSAVPGAVDCLLACRFKFTTLQPSAVKNQRSSNNDLSSKCTPIINNQKPNAIQLIRDDEDRNVLIFGRVYLHKFGQRVLGLQIEDNVVKDATVKNELGLMLPNLRDFPELQTNKMLQTVGENIDKMMKDALKKSKDDDARPLPERDITKMNKDAVKSTMRSKSRRNILVENDSQESNKDENTFECRENEEEEIKKKIHNMTQSDSQVIENNTQNCKSDRSTVLSSSFRSLLGSFRSLSQSNFDKSLIMDSTQHSCHEDDSDSIDSIVSNLNGGQKTEPDNNEDNKVRSVLNNLFACRAHPNSNLSQSQHGEREAKEDEKFDIPHRSLSTIRIGRSKKIFTNESENSDIDRGEEKDATASTNCALLPCHELYRILKDKLGYISTSKENIDSGSMDKCPLFELFHDKTKTETFKSIRSFLQRKKMNLDKDFKTFEKQKDKIELMKESANDIGNALHFFAIAVGDILENYSEEIDLYNEAIRLKRMFNFMENNISFAHTLFQMGRCYYNQGELRAAMSRFTESLCIFNTSLERSKRNVAETLYCMGIIHFDLGELDESLESFDGSLAMCEDLESLDQVNTLCWIAKVHRERGEYDSAHDRFLEALSQVETLVGKDHLDTATTLQHLGVICDDLGNLDQSLKYYQECLRIRRSILGDNYHRDVCETLQFIANLLWKSDSDKSLQMFRLITKALNTKSLKSTDDCNSLLKIYEDLLHLLKKKLEANISDKPIQDEIASLLMKIGQVYEKLENFHDAAAYYNKSLKIRKIRRDHQNIGTILNTLGIVHAKRKSFQKAMKCFSDSLLIRKAVHGDEHPDVGETLHNIGNCAAKQNLIERALESYSESLSIKQKTHGYDSATCMKTLHNMGMIYEATHNIEKALCCYQDAFKARSKIHGEKHIDLAFSLHSIGKLHLRQEQFKDAKECFQRSLEIKRAHYVGTHLSVAETSYQLALTLLKLGDAEDAQEYLKLSLCVFEKELGTHIDTGNVLDSLGSICETKGDLNNAHHYLERSLVLKRMLLGNDSIAVSNTLYLIGKVQVKSGDVEDSLNTLKEVLRIRKNILGNDCLEVAAVVNDVGVIQLRRSNKDIAKSCFIEAMRIWHLYLDDGHEYFGETLLNLGDIEYADSNFDDAIEKLSRAMKIFEDNRGGRHLSIALASAKLGRCYQEKGDFDSALAVYEKAISIRTTQSGANSFLVAETIKDLGSLHLEKGEYSKARNYLVEALKTMSCTNSNTIKIADASFLLGQVMVKMDNKDEAIAYFEDALKIRRRRLPKEDLEDADILFQLGLVHEEDEDVETSISFYNRAIEIRISILEGDDEIVADIHHNIGALLQSSENYEGALKSFGAALFAYQASLGDEHLSCAKTMNNIGIVYERTHEYKESMKYHKEALRIRQIILGKDHLKIANSLDNIAGLYQKQKEIDAALKCLKEAMRIRTSRLGNDHVEVATTLFGMGILFCDQGDVDKAMDCYEASLKIRRAKIGESSLEVGQTLHNMGSVCALKHEYKHAFEHWESSLQIYRNVGLSDEHHLVACTIGNMEMAKKLLLEEEED